MDLDVDTDVDTADVLDVLPRGRHNLSRGQVRASQRHRMLHGMADVVAEKGYVDTSVGEVLKRVHISRETFYEHFTGKQDCFLAAFDRSADVLLATARDALGPPTDPALARLDRMLRAYLGNLVANPAQARTFLIEVYGAGPAAVTRRVAAQQRFADTLAEVLADDERWSHLPDQRFAARAMVGAISSVVTAWLDAGNADQLAELRQPLLDLFTALAR